MELLSYGFQKPEDNDTGDILFPALQENWQKVNDHTHDGVNSARVAKERLQITAGNWNSAPVPLAPYTTTIQLPEGMTFDNTVIIVTDFVTGQVVPLDTEKTSDTDCTLYTNNPTDYWVLFL